MLDGATALPMPDMCSRTRQDQWVPMLAGIPRRPINCINCQLLVAFTIFVGTLGLLKHPSPHSKTMLRVDALA